MCHAIACDACANSLVKVLLAMAKSKEQYAGEGKLNTAGKPSANWKQIGDLEACEDVELWICWVFWAPFTTFCRRDSWCAGLG